MLFFYYCCTSEWHTWRLLLTVYTCIVSWNKIMYFSPSKNKSYLSVNFGWTNSETGSKLIWLNDEDFRVSARFESMYAPVSNSKCAGDDHWCKIVRETFSSIHLIKYGLGSSDFTFCPLKLATCWTSWNFVSGWTT